MSRVEELSKGAADWLSQRLITATGKLSNRDEAMDFEVLNVLTDLMGPEASINLANGMLAVKRLGRQQAGLTLARQLRSTKAFDFSLFCGRSKPPWYPSFVDLANNFLKKTVERFSGEGEELVKQLLGAQVDKVRDWGVHVYCYDFLLLPITT